MKGTIFSIKRYTIHDGPGIRTTVFFKGCPMQCWWCHNPEGISPTPQSMPHLRRGLGSDIETVGREVDVEDVMQEIEKERIFFDESGGGVTFSGGEPLLQPAFLAALLDQCRARAIHTVVDTCGYAPTRDMELVADKADLFFFDLKLVDDTAHIKYTGVSNAPVFDNLRLLLSRNRPVIARIPIIPGITDAALNIEQLISLITSMPGLTNVCLLPYHQAGDAKYRRLALDNRMAGIAPPTPEHMAGIRSQFELHHLHTTIGG